MIHIYSCKQLNKYEEVNSEEYLNIYSGNLRKQIKVFRRFQQNFEIRESYLNTTEKDANITETHVVPSLCDPLFSVRV